jgi:hypothetical protein
MPGSGRCQLDESVFEARANCPIQFKAANRQLDDLGLARWF